MKGVESATKASTGSEAEGIGSGVLIGIGAAAAAAVAVGGVVLFRRRATVADRE